MHRYILTIIGDIRQKVVLDIWDKYFSESLIDNLTNVSLIADTFSVV